MTAPSLDHDLALKMAADRLEREFGGAVPDAEIEQFLQDTYEHIADHATLDKFLPLLAERYTREWLRERTS
ncbi:hypothetical protein IU468_05650 [Nocardia farcinica]|uniref:three-helix bundle dimerization domain-containing protein n=1 Tax=Nocardia farcinica TaxID=37329 RepID=UPI00189619F2|nr:hypothetical protein [Nocardia farcinica]MBF6255801.1 hypothetical protein [Nocardia farcinica]